MGAPQGWRWFQSVGRLGYHQAWHHRLFYLLSLCSSKSKLLCRSSVFPYLDLICLLFFCLYPRLYPFDFFFIYFFYCVALSRRKKKTLYTRNMSLIFTDPAWKWFKSGMLQDGSHVFASASSSSSSASYSSPGILFFSLFITMKLTECHIPAAATPLSTVIFSSGQRRTLPAPELIRSSFHGM